MIKQLINGEPNSQLSVTDRGLHYGDGVFETIAVRNGHIQFLQEHYARLKSACDRLQLNSPSLNTIKADIAELIRGDVDTEGNDHLNTAIKIDAVIKIIVTRGPGGRGYKLPETSSSNRIAILYPYPDYPLSLQKAGVAITLCETRVSRNIATAGLKHLNRLENVLASAEWQNSGFMEGLMLDENGHIIEGTMSNVFIVEQGAIITPKLTHSGVTGIVRDKVMNLAKQQGWAVNEENITANRLKSADEIFITNSVIGLWPVNTVNQQPYTAGCYTMKISSLLQDLFKDELTGVVKP